MDYNIDELINNLGLSGTEAVSYLLSNELVYALVSTDSVIDAANTLGITTAALTNIITRHWTKYFPDKPFKIKWDAYLLSFIYKKKCKVCAKILSLDQFNLDKDNWDGKKRYCKECQSSYRHKFTIANPKYARYNYLQNKADYIARSIVYKTRRKVATPPWANLTEIRRIYSECPAGCHVDHIVPLQGANVSGLHVESNLQYLPATANLKKSNKYAEVP